MMLSENDNQLLQEDKMSFLIPTRLVVSAMERYDGEPRNAMTMLSISFTGNPVKFINTIKHKEMHKMAKMMGYPDKNLSDRKSESLATEGIIINWKLWHHR